jgi:ATP-dependent Clp protease, protease subunit
MAKVFIKGPIVSNSDYVVYEWLGLDATSPKTVTKVIENAKDEELEVEINSPGGNVFAASEIYTMLREHKELVTVKIVGIAASAASVIAMAGKKVLMAPTAQMMIHNVSTMATGDYRSMEHTAQVLKGANDTIANAYRLKSGMSHDDLLRMMDKETWLTPQQALGYRLIDGILFEGSKVKETRAKLESLKLKEGK